MSHEIRTPMNSILGLSNLMEKVGDLNPKQSDYLKTIKINSKNLLGIINDILDLSKIEEGKLEIEESSFNLKDLIHALVKSLNLIAHKKKIELKEIFDASLPEFLLGDSVRLNQVLLNLTNNAIKFTNEGSVSIELSKLDETDDSIQIYFAIKDTGIGIHPEKIDTIFEPFTQETSSTTRLFGGTGLGLTISSKIIRALGGQINVTSEIEVGSTFSFILTLKKDTSKITIETTPSENIELFGKYKILLVEDNPFNQMVAEDTLKEWNGELEIDIIDNGKDAIQQLKENTYDLVLLDIQMPEMDGHEVCRIARNELKITTPILAMTAQATQKEIETCFLNGMNDYISKPFEEKTLFSKIVNWIK
jgi:CheY-like chemotaxis protein